MSPLAIFALVGVGGYLAVKASSSGSSGGAAAQPSNVAAEAEKKGYAIGYSDGIAGKPLNNKIDDGLAQGSGDPMAFIKGYERGYKEGSAKYDPNAGGGGSDTQKFIDDACKRSTGMYNLPKPSGSDTSVAALPDEYKQIAMDILSTVSAEFASGEIGQALRQTHIDTANAMADDFACSGYVDAAKQIYAHSAEIAMGGQSALPGPSGMPFNMVGPVAGTVSAWRRGGNDFRL